LLKWRVNFILSVATNIRFDMETFFLDIVCKRLCILLLSFFCLGISSNAQIPEFQNSENFKLIRLHYSNSIGEEGITEFDFDSKGILLFASWRLLNNERSSINYYSYSSDHKLIEKTRIFSDSITTQQSFKYNRCGFLENETYHRSDGINGTVKYLYDDTGNLISADCQGLNGWFYGRIKYCYNIYGIRDRAEIFDKTQKIGEIEYDYDINGNLKKEFWDFKEIWTQTFSYEYYEIPKTTCITSNPYIKNGQFFQIESEYYEYSGAVGGPSDYTYNEDGMLLGKTYSRSDGLITETDYQYNDQGLLITSVRKYKDGMIANYYYEFDPGGNLISCKYKRSDGLEGTELYFYNDKGLLMRSQHKNKDAWLSGVIVYEHFEDGRIKNGFFDGDDNFNADLMFTYDEYHNLIKIRWDFTYDKSQIYTFKYKPLYKDKYSRPFSLQ